MSNEIKSGDGHLDFNQFQKFVFLNGKTGNKSAISTYNARATEESILERLLIKIKFP